MPLVRSLSLALLLSLVPAAGLQAQRAGGPHASGTATSQKSWSTTFRLNGSHQGEPAFRLEVDATGVVLAPDQDAVAGLHPDGSLRITHELLGGYADPDPLRAVGSRATLVRTLQVTRGPDGEVRHAYAVNGRSREFGPEGQAWLTRILRQSR